MTPIEFTPSVMIFLVGLGFLVGSFLNVCIVRLPREESVVLPASRCVKCGKRIHWYHNIPVLSFLWLRGRCASCGKRFSARYLAVEIVTPCLFAVVLWKQPYWEAALFHFYLMSALVVSTFVDLEHWIIPDAVTLPGIVIGLASAFFVPGHSLLDAGAGLLLGGGSLLLIGSIYSRWKGIDGIGGGDVKFLAMSGAFLGAKGALTVLILSSLAGSLVGAVIMARTGKGGKTAVQFGPFLALGVLAAYLWGDALAEWYFGLARPRFD